MIDEAEIKETYDSIVKLVIECGGDVKKRVGGNITAGRRVRKSLRNAKWIIESFNRSMVALDKERRTEESSDANDASK